MHQGILDYCAQYKDQCTGKKVLEVGSKDFNGTVRKVLPITIGTDMETGEGVDLICKGEELPQHFQPGEFDVVVSCDTFEHVRYWREFLNGIWTVLKDDGLFVCTIAHLNKRRHAYPDDYWRLLDIHIPMIFKGQEIIEINPNLSGISFGFTIKKKSPLIDLTDIHLIPVDGKVPVELLKPQDPTAPFRY